jgi:hypothetical protein
MRQACPHGDAVQPVPAPLDVCEACIEIGGEWVHLRQCLTCGRTLCCNDSPNRHMTAHWNETGHPLMRGASPGEQWAWCFADDAMVRETPDGWETYDPFLETGALVARDHLASGGSPDPAEDFVTRHGFPLGEWFSYVRDSHGDGTLDPQDAELVEAIPGWRW